MTQNMAYRCKRLRIPLLFILAGIGVRLYAAWTMRHNINLDAGVVTLMARHIALGQELPIFFYGQPHMGSLEALWSAFFCRILGISGFAVCLGTVFVSIGVLPIAYHWAADAAGKRAGCIALALVIIGPLGFFHYNASPRGGYAAALTFGAFLVWYATRMSIKWQEHRAQSGWDYLMLGLAAGLAWWSNQITTAAILAAGLILLSVLKWQAFTWRLIPGLFGFLTGSAPFWYYNIVNDWASFAFGESFGRVAFHRALIWLYTQRFPSLLFPDNQPRILHNISAVLILLLGGYGLLMIFRKQTDIRTKLTIRGLALFTFIFSILFASSHFAAIATPRYTLPLFVPLVVLLAISTDQITRHPPTLFAGWLPVSLIIALQTLALPWAWQFERIAAATHERIMMTGQELQNHGHTQLYAPLPQRAWNFLLEERVIFSELRNNFYMPHLQALENQDDIAFFVNHGNPQQFIRDAGGSKTTSFYHNHSVQWNFSAPPLDQNIIPSWLWESAISSTGQCVLEVLTDNRVDTEAKWPPATGQQTLLVRFVEPQNVSGLRFISPNHRSVPMQLLVEGLTPSGEWVSLRERANLTHFFWSGPRPFYYGVFDRTELRFPVRTVEAIRFNSSREHEHTQWIMQSMDFFTPGPLHETEHAAFPELLALLKQYNIQNLYADRWVANAVYRETNGAIITSRDPTIFPNEPRLPIDEMFFCPATAIVVLQKNTENLKQAADNRISLKAPIIVGPWSVFLPHQSWSGNTANLYWVGFSLQRNDVARAAALAHEANMVRQSDAPEEAIALLREAIQINPILYHERILLRNILRQQKMGTEAERIDKEIQAIEPPDGTFAPVRFANGVELTGLRLERLSLNKVRLTYHWQVPPEILPERIAAFVHFVSDSQIVMQDDHVFLSDIPSSLLAHQTHPLPVAISREISVPHDVPVQQIEIRIGLYNRVNGMRLQMKTDLPTRRKSAILPVQIPEL